MGLSDREFWDCSFSQFFRLYRRWLEEQQREDWRAWIAGVASVMEKPPKPSEAFASLSALSVGSVKRADIPKGWTVYTGRDLKVVGQVSALPLMGQFQRSGSKATVQ